jgi:hypothetical protein
VDQESNTPCCEPWENSDDAVKIGARWVLQHYQQYCIVPLRKELNVINNVNVELTLQYRGFLILNIVGGVMVHRDRNWTLGRQVRILSWLRWATRWLRVKRMNNVPVITNGIVWNNNNVRFTKRALIRKEIYRRIGCESPQLNLLRLCKAKSNCEGEVEYLTSLISWSNLVRFQAYATNKEVYESPELYTKDPYWQLGKTSK